LISYHPSTIGKITPKVGAPGLDSRPCDLISL
jgi:hypothetical protein